MLTHNGKKLEGRWILVHFNIRGDAKTIIDKTESDGVIIDVANVGELLNALKTSDSTPQAYRVPLWINLDADEIKAATTHAGENKTPTPFKVTFGSNSPVEEENYFYITIKDTNANATSLSEDNAKPELFGEEIIELAEKESGIETELKKVFKNDTSEPFCANNDNAKAFLQNLEKLQSAKINYEYSGDTVYINIEDDFTKYSKEASGSKFRIGLELNVETLGVKEGNDMCFYNDGTNKWIDTKADGNGIIYFTILLQGQNYTDLTQDTKKSVTKEYIFATGKKPDSSAHSTEKDKCDTVKANEKYIRYVITLTPKK